MTSYEMVYHSGNLETTYWDALFKPRKIRGASKYGVILLHGATSGGTPTEIYSPSFPHMHRLIACLAMEGIPCVAGAMVAGGAANGNTYANDAISGTSATTPINKALDYMAAQTGCSG